MKTVKRFLTVLYIKWVKGECRHFCVGCEFKNQCYDNIEF